MELLEARDSAQLDLDEFPVEEFSGARMERALLTSDSEAMWVPEVIRSSLAIGLASSGS